MTDEKPAKVFKKVKVDAAETIRKRLGLTMGQFSEALGFAEGSYHVMVKEGLINQTAALAAEALMRRQAAVSDVCFLIRVVKGAPRVEMLEDPRTIRLDGQEFILVPVTT